MRGDVDAIQRIDQLQLQTTNAQTLTDLEAVIESGIEIYNEKNISM